MHIDLASTQVAAARHGDLGAMETTQQGTHHSVEARILATSS